jgi:hypothetical protein
MNFRNDARDVENGSTDARAVIDAIHRLEKEHRND